MATSEGRLGAVAAFWIVARIGIVILALGIDGLDPVGRNCGKGCVVLDIMYVGEASKELCSCHCQLLS